MVISTVIVELGLTFGFLSLINYQGKMLERYNDYKEEQKEIKEENVESVDRENTEVTPEVEQTNSNENEKSAVETQEVPSDITEEKNENNNVNDDAEIDKMAEEIKNLS